MKTTFTYEPLTQQEQSQYNALYESYSNGGPVFDNDDYRAFRDTLEHSDPRLTTNYIRDTVGFRNGMDPEVSHSRNYLTDGKLGANPASSSSSSKSPAEAKYITAKDALDAAKQNLNYATDPMQESQMRKELQMAQLAYDAAKEEFAKSKLQEANLITEDQAAGREPITPRNGRNYEGVGKKAQNPDKVERESLGQKEQLPDISNLNQLALQQGPQKIGEQELVPGRANQAGYRATNTITGGVKGFGADVANAAGTVVRGMGESSASANPAVLKAQGLSDDQIKAELEKASSQNKGQRMVDTGTNIQESSDRLAQSSAEDIAQAKQGLNGVGRFAVDIGSNAIQMGGDALAAVLTGGAVNPLTSMFVRSAGGAAREARNEGASTGQQLAYGAVRGGIEVLTEKMFDGLAGLYGKGGADDIVESVIGKLAGSSDAGKTALRTLFSGVGEAIEEGVSGATEPLTQAIYKGIRSIPEGYNKEQASDVLYSMLVGFAMGGAGSAVNILNGGNAEANAKLNEAAATTEQNTNPRAGMPSEAWEQQNVNQNPIAPQNGRNYEGTGKKAQNPEKAAAQAAQTAQAQQTEQPVWDGKSYKGYTLEAGYGHDGDTVYRIISPDGRTVGESDSVLLPKQLTEDVIELINNDIAKNGQPAETTSEQPAAETPPEQPVSNPAAESTTTPETPQESTEAPSGELNSEPESEEKSEEQNDAGNGENWSGPEVQTQSTVHDQLTEEEKARDDLNPENDTHIQHHDEEVDTFANNRITEKGHEGAREDLMSRDPAEWDDVDVRTAQMLLEEELENARQLTGEEQDAAYRRIADLKNAYNKQGTEAGRSLRQRQRFGGTKTEMVSEAANILYGEENKGKTRKLSPDQKSAIMQQVDEFSTKLENAQQGDTASIKDIIMQVAKVRKTSGFLDFGQGKLGKVIDTVAKMEGGEDFLRQLATTQIRSIAGDQVKASFWDKAKALRYMNMLSNPATASRNVGANTVFGNFIDAVSSNLSSPIDALMSLATGKRTVRTERLSKAGLKGSVEAGLKSWLEVSLDAEAEQSTYAYNEIKGRTFKASGNFIEHILSVLERNQGYQLKTTDQIAKGGIEGETKRNLMKGGMDEATAEQLAKEEAEYRTLQNNSGISTAANKLREALNVIGIKDKNGKTLYGLGEDLLPFAQVPANVVQTELNLNPLSIFTSLGKIANVMAKGKNATASEQRAAAKAFGTAVNGTALVAAAALASAKGIIRYTDDDDKDQKQLHKAQGKTGLQINFSAFGRLFTGGDPAEQEGDKWGSIGWIPQINSLFIIGNMVYDDYKDMPEHKDLADWAKFSGKVGLDSLKGMYESILEFPAVSTITSMYNAAKYANVPDDATEAERLGIQAGSILADKAANTLTGFTIPNVLRATAAGLDDTERNLYTADNRLMQAVDSVKAGIPDNPLIPKEYTRGSLPAQTDNFGNPIKNEGGTQQFLNKVILPGAITTDQRNALLDEIDRVAMSSGNADAIPDKNGAYSVTYNGEKIKLSAEERDEYHRYAGEKSEDYIKSFVGSSIYQDMTDDQRAETMAKLNQQAKSEANKHYLETHGYDAVDKLTDGKDAPGTTYDNTPLNSSNVAKYYAHETLLESAIADGDYKTIDKLSGQFKSYNNNLQTVLLERDDSLRQIIKWKDAGINSETYYAFKDATIESQKRLDKSTKKGSDLYLDALAHMNIPESEKRKIINNVPDLASKTAIGVFNTLADYGYSSQIISGFWEMSQDWVYKDTGASESSTKKGVMNPLEAAYAISRLPGNLSDAQRENIYQRIKEVANNPYAPNDWKNYTYGSEVNYLASGKAKQSFGGNSSGPTFEPQTTGQTSQKFNSLLNALGIAG